MGPQPRPARNTAKPTTYSENGTRRSSAAVQAEKEAKANKKAQQDREAKQAAKSAAQRESESRARARLLKENPGGTAAADLPPKSDRKRPTHNSGADPKPKKRRIKEIVYETASEADDDEGDDEVAMDDKHSGDSDPRFDAEMRELEEASGGSDTYEPPAEEDEEDESDMEEDIELEEDECDTALEKRRGERKKEKRGKGEKPGVSLRKGIQKVRDGSPDTPMPRHEADYEFVTALSTSLLTTATTPYPNLSTSARDKPRTKKDLKSKAASHEGRAGMRPNYKPGPPLLPNLKKPTPAAEDDDAEDDGPMQQEGDIFGDVEQDEGERDELMKSSTGAKAITKFGKIDSSSKYIAKTAKRSLAQSSSPSPAPTKRAKVTDLPQAAKLYWKSIKAYAINEVAALGPWTELPDTAIVKIWNDHVNDECPITATPSTDKQYQLFRMVKSLLVNQVLPTEWRFKLRDAAVKAVIAEWALRNLTTKEARARFARIMLGKEPRNRASEDRPFVYSSTDSLEWDGDSDASEATRDGVLEGRMVLRTLSAHFDILGSLVPEEERTKKVYGALALAIQAVNRALEYSLTGTMVIPDQKTGHFSAENWADFMSTTEKDGKTVRKHVRRATIWIGTMEQCPDVGWERIIDGAKSFSSANLKKENTFKTTINADTVEMPEKKVIGFNSAWATKTPNGSSSSPPAGVASESSVSVTAQSTSDV